MKNPQVQLGRHRLHAYWKSPFQAVSRSKGRLSLATDYSVRKIQHLESKSAVLHTLNQKGACRSLKQQKTS